MDTIRQHLACTNKSDLDLFYIGSQKREGCEGSRTDSKTFTGSCGRITERIERIGTLTHFCGQTRHLCVTSCIISDRTVSIRSERDTQRREHTDSCNTDTVETHREVSCAELYMETVRAEVSQHDSNTYRYDRDSRREHTETQTADDNGSRTGLRTLRHFLRRLVTLRGVVLGRLTDDHTGDQTYDYGQAHLPPLVRIRSEEPSEDTEGHSGNQETGCVGTDSKRSKQFFHTCTLFGLHQIDTDDREQHTACCDKRRSHNGFQLHFFAESKRRCTKSHGSQD